MLGASRNSNIKTKERLRKAENSEKSKYWRACPREKDKIINLRSKQNIDAPSNKKG